VLGCGVDPAAPAAGIGGKVGGRLRLETRRDLWRGTGRTLRTQPQSAPAHRGRLPVRFPQSTENTRERILERAAPTRGCPHFR
jgi:hypothetical protein